MDHNSYPTRMVYVGMAAIAGAITALSFMNWKTMSRSEIGLTIFVGTVFALFAVPYITVDLLHIGNDTLRAACGLTFLGGTFSNALMPLLLRKIRKWWGLTDEDLPS